MTPNDDIRDLLGRYATGSLTAAEQQRLFDAALDDQDLFNELAREQDIKQLLDEPGARARLIRALEPPKRKTAWIFGAAATAALTAVLVLFFIRPTPKPQPVPQAPIQMAKSEPPPPPPPVVESETTVSAPQRREVEKRKEVENKVASEVAKDTKEAPSARDQIALAAPMPSPASAPEQLKKAQPVRAQQNAPSGPRQDQQSQVTVSGFAGRQVTAFGFFYSIETEGHLTLVPVTDGYLSVRSDDNAVLFASQRIAAGIVIDVVVPKAVNSVSVTFSENSLPVATTPVLHSEPSGTVRGIGPIAIKIIMVK